MTAENIVVLRVVMSPEKMKQIRSHAEAHGMTEAQFARFSLHNQMRLDQSQGFKEYVSTFFNPWFFPYRPEKA